jgi:hypothetical protein
VPALWGTARCGSYDQQVPPASAADLTVLLTQVAHAADMLNNLPVLGNDDTVDDLTDDELRLLRHAARESWAINARLLSQFILGDSKGEDARSYMPNWRSHDPVLKEWRSVASEHVAHLSPRRAQSPVREVSAEERRRVTTALNRELLRFTGDMRTSGFRDWADTLAELLAGIGVGPGGAATNDD